MRRSAERGERERRSEERGEEERSSPRSYFWGDEALKKDSKVSQSVSIVRIQKSDMK